MVDNNFWGILFFLVTAGAVVLLAILQLISRFIPATDADYVNTEEEREAGAERVFSAFERPEQSQNVQAVQALNGDALSLDDITRIDDAARVLSFGWAGEAAIIEGLFDGVKRGGSKRYIAIRDAVRVAAASRYGWRPAAPTPEPTTDEPRRIPISEGKGGYVEI